MLPRLILGIGNILLRDEGIGVRVVEAMRGLELPPDVELIDGGTSGADLVDILADREKVIVLDALDWNEPPGTIFRLPADELIPEPGEAISLHQLGLVETLAITRLLQCTPREVIVLGIQPKAIEPGLELTPELSAAIPRAVQAVVAELAADRCLSQQRFAET